MKAMVLKKLSNLEENKTPLELEDLPDPQPGEREVLVTVSTCGVCHTELDEIEGRTLGACLLETNNILDQINNEIDCSFQIGMRIQTFQPGSFEVPVELHPIILYALFAPSEFLPHIRQSIKVLTEFLSLKKMLRGTEPKEIIKGDGNTIIKNSDNTSITIHNNTYNLFQNNGTANTSMEKQFQQLSEDHSIECFEITDHERNSLFKSDRNDFEGMAQKQLTQSKDTLEEVKRVDLHIIKPVLDKKPSAWRFMHKGIQISAQMKDTDFLERVIKGEQFAMGDRLQADMKIRQEFDNSLQTHIIKYREILKVHNHIPRPTQGNLDL